MKSFNIHVHVCVDSWYLSIAMGPFMFSVHVVVFEVLFSCSCSTVQVVIQIFLCQTFPLIRASFYTQQPAFLCHEPSVASACFQAQSTCHVQNNIFFTGPKTDLQALKNCWASSDINHIGLLELKLKPILRLIALKNCSRTKKSS